MMIMSMPRPAAGHVGYGHGSNDKAPPGWGRGPGLISTPLLFAFVSIVREGLATLP
jgi:hypothetical protein